MKYVRKPITVEANQWFIGDMLPGVQYDRSMRQHFIETIYNNQRIYLEEGDFVILEPDGVHYRCEKQVTFLETHIPGRHILKIMNPVGESGETL